MTPTIRDVADLAGVSTATVSRVLARADNVTDETLRRVTAAIEELDYRPSGVARSLRKRTTAVIGLIVTDITNPYYPEVVLGVEDAAHRQGRSVLLCNATDTGDRDTEYLDVLLERRVDAVIVASGGVARRQAERLASLPMPVVLANVAVPEYPLPAIVSDDHQGGVLAGRHLLDCGYGRVVHIAGPSESGGTSRRLAGVEEGTGDNELMSVLGEGSLEGGANAMRELAEMIEPPFGVAAHNDLSAIGALSTLEELGWAVPEEVGVVGFDDIALSRFVTPRLTTVAQDKYELGARAAETVSLLLNKEVVEPTTMVPVELIERETTGAVARRSGPVRKG